MSIHITHAIFPSHKQFFLLIRTHIHNYSIIDICEEILLWIWMIFRITKIPKIFNKFMLCFLIHLSIVYLIAITLIHKTFKDNFCFFALYYVLSVVILFMRNPWIFMLPLNRWSRGRHPVRTPLTLVENGLNSTDMYILRVL